MKKLLQTTLLACSLLFIASCSSDDPEPDKIIGTWILDNGTYSNPPAAYSLQAGDVESIYGESEYKIRFFDDMTYERDVTGNGGSFEDEGTYSQTGDKLELDYEKGTTGLDLEFDVVGDITDKNLDIITSTQITALSDAILNDKEFQDTVTTNAQYFAVLEERGVVITLDLTYYFDRE
ncbi:MAG: lipocalin family protein [Reichenbachiella sp.]|uniref:lipocalin family protein n=1 Tax=Reichenbachiella sp. TaxID=2184521 RepID=UPI003298FAD6